MQDELEVTNDIPGQLPSDDNGDERISWSETEQASDDIIKSFLKLKEHGQSSRTRALRLREGDVIVAVDGQAFNEAIDVLVDLLSSDSDDNAKWLLTIWRNGKFFEIFSRGPLGGILEFTRPEESKIIEELFGKREMGKKEEYRIYEALRDVKRVVDVYDTSYSNIAVVVPPIWLVQNKMWEPLLAVLCVYLLTFSVNIFLFVIAAILLGFYFKQGQVTLRRSYGMFQDRQVWAILAARTDLEAQETCRVIDEKVNFINSKVKPIKKEVKKAKRKNKTGNLPKLTTQFN
jgi:uncharacterized membrane protein YvlD (DUF360 family)